MRNEFVPVEQMYDYELALARVVSVDVVREQRGRQLIRMKEVSRRRGMTPPEMFDDCCTLLIAMKVTDV